MKTIDGLKKGNSILYAYKEKFSFNKKHLSPI